jgi:uncharacterized protein
MEAGRANAPHLPQAAPIDAYGNGGFRFAGMSHRGSLLCLPQGMWAWAVARPEEIDAAALAGVIAASDTVDTLLIGTGSDIWLAPQPLREHLRRYKIVLDVMQTPPAIRMYNIMVGERRRVAAALIAMP